MEGLLHEAFGHPLHVLPQNLITSDSTGNGIILPIRQLLS